MSGRRRWGTLAGVAVAAVVIGCGAVAATSLEGRYAAAAEQLAATNTGLASAADRVEESLRAIAAAGDESETLTEVLAEREGFTAAVARVRDAASAASGKVAVDDQVAQVHALGERMLAVTDDPAAVAAMTAEVVSVAEGMEQQVAAFDEAQRAQAAASWSSAGSGRSSSGGGATSSGSPSTASGPTSTGGGGDAISRARPILDSLGGSWVQLGLFDGYCSGVYTTGCSTSGLIQIRPDTVGLGDAKFRWLIVHEFSHQVQLTNWNAITSHPTYYALFGGNIELLSNCMASAWGATAHGHSCSPQMIEEASYVWNGSFR